MNQMSGFAQHGDGEGAIHFSGADRSLIEEDQIELISVGVDIGSSTSHLLFSAIVLERLDTRYVVAERRVLHASDILLTPYSEGEEIDADALRGFIETEYAAAGIKPGAVDTGALILTGVAARRKNARAIGEIFADEAGKFVALSAGDSLECLMAAHGSGAVGASRAGGPVVNIDVGGGTTKIAVCADGEVVSRTAIDVGARLVAFDKDGKIGRLEPFGAHHLGQSGINKGLGDILTREERARLTENMAAHIWDVLDGRDAPGLMRLPPLETGLNNPRIIFSGGVSEYLAGLDRVADDLGPDLAEALRAGVAGRAKLMPARQTIRATVVGASQYTVQVSGSTIFLDPMDVLPLKNLAVIAPALDLGEDIEPSAVAGAVRDALERLDLGSGDRPVAVFVPWVGSATYARLKNLATGLVVGLRKHLDAGHPFVLVTESDIGGLLGMQARSEENIPGAVVSIDGISLAEFDFIDIGAVLRATGAAPVVIKSLLFPGA